MRCIHTAHKQVLLRLCAAVFVQNKDPTSQVFGITYKPQAPDSWLCPCSWGWGPAVNYPTPRSCPGMKWDIKTNQLYTWLDNSITRQDVQYFVTCLTQVLFIFMQSINILTLICFSMCLLMFCELKLFWWKCLLEVAAHYQSHYNMWQSTSTEHKICLIHFWSKCRHCVKLHWTAISVSSNEHTQTAAAISDSVYKTSSPCTICKLLMLLQCNPQVMVDTLLAVI